MWIMTRDENIARERGKRMEQRSLFSTHDDFYVGNSTVALIYLWT